MAGTIAQIEAQIMQRGFAVVDRVLEGRGIDCLLGEMEKVDRVAEGTRPDALYAVRNLLQAVPAARTWADSAPIRSLIEPILGPDCFVVRGLFFDKPPEANWKVPWHQDLCVAVRSRREVAGFGPWSEKAGVPHAYAPVSLLERMLIVRLHLDDCDETNGPLRVLPGTHRYGRIDAAQIRALRETIPEVVCAAPRRSALLMRPLLLHASSAALRPHHRRVVHLEFAAESLPDALEWYEQSGHQPARGATDAATRPL